MKIYPHDLTKSRNSLADALNPLAPGNIALSLNTTATSQTVAITLKIDPAETEPAPDTYFDVARRFLLQQHWTIPVDVGNPANAARVVLNSANVLTLFPSVIFPEAAGQTTIIATRFAIHVNAQLFNNGEAIGQQNTETEIAIQDQGEFTGVEIWPLSQTAPYPVGTVAVVTFSIAAEAVIDRHAPLVDTGSGVNTPVISPGVIVVAAPAPLPDTNETSTTAPIETSTAANSQTSGGGAFSAFELMVSGLLLAWFARRKIARLP